MWNSFSPAYSEFSDNHRLPAQFDGAIYDSDEFRMFQFKIKLCPRQRSHDWTKCPFAHPGEKAARRDPHRFYYCGVPCPELRIRGACRRGETCLFAHGVFERWLHPEKYRTKLCTAGMDCQRQVCFFAHTLRELRAEKPPLYKYHFMHQLSPQVPKEVAGKGFLTDGAGATSSSVASSSVAAPASSDGAFTGGTDFLASLSGARVEQEEDKQNRFFGWYEDDPNAPDIAWVEEVMVD